MATSIGNGDSRHGIPWRIIGWGMAALLLSLPYFTNWPWTIGDFVVMGVLFALVGLAVEYMFSKSGSPSYRFGAATAIVTAFLTLWVNIAVGMIGDGPYNLLFGGVLLVAIGGAALARFEPAGMARAMLAAAGVQAIASAIGLSIDPNGGLLSMTFTVPWLLAAACFRRAARAPDMANGSPPA